MHHCNIETLMWRISKITGVSYTDLTDFLKGCRVFIEELNVVLYTGEVLDSTHKSIVDSTGSSFDIALFIVHEIALEEYMKKKGRVGK